MTNTSPLNNRAGGDKVVEMANIVRILNIEPASELREAFEGAICKRGLVNQHFANKDIVRYGRKSNATLQHEWYADRLAEAKDILFPPSQGTQNGVAQPSSPIQPRGNTIAVSTYNSFDALSSSISA
jgi:hypothetical protein